MGRKSVRDMGPVERWLHSLTVRSTIGVQLLALAVGAIVLFAGFMLYYKGIIYEYKVETSQMAKAESVMLDPEKTRVKTDEILSIYDSVPDSEKGDGFSPEYLEKYASVQDEQFRDIQRAALVAKFANLLAAAEHDGVRRQTVEVQEDAAVLPEFRDRDVAAIPCEMPAARIVLARIVVMVENAFVVDGGHFGEAPLVI